MATREILFSIEKFVEQKSEELLQIRNLVLDQKVSNYPIFVFQKPSQAILGSKIMDQSQNSDRWNVFISHLEEMYHKKIVLEDKLEDFQFQYKNNNDKYCILLVEDESNHSFLFTPILD